MSTKNFVQHAVEEGFCPRCQENIRRVFDSVSDEPVTEEIVDITCSACGWSINDSDITDGVIKTECECDDGQCERYGLPGDLLDGHIDGCSCFECHLEVA